MFIRKKGHRSGNIGVIVVEKIGAKIKNESQEVKSWILEQPKRDCQMVEYDKGGGRRLLVGYTDDRAKKDAYNREKGIRRLEKAYKHGALTKGNINKRGYNKFLSMDGEVKVTINYDRIADDSRWDGLKDISPIRMSQNRMYTRLITTFGMWNGPSA
jgi:hypothetical protein